MALYLGCPIWSNKSWVGPVFQSTSKASQYLSQYASIFNTVEGNTTFYGIPKETTVAKWGEETPPGFRFCFKFPRSISHEAGLVEAEGDLNRFLGVLDPLANRLGPFFLQLPPHFCDFGVLERFLVKLPRRYSYAVEVRHQEFYEGGPLETDYVEMLTELGMDRVIFDTRRLQTMATDDDDMRDAQRRKPNSPVRFQATGPRPFLRFVGNPNYEKDLGTLQTWARWVAGWMEAGKIPYVFMHQAPDDDLAPQLCRFFYGLVAERVPSLPPMPDFPGENEPPREEQLSLF